MYSIYPSEVAHEKDIELQCSGFGAAALGLTLQSHGVARRQNEMMTFQINFKNDHLSRQHLVFPLCLTAVFDSGSVYGF